MVKLIRKNNQRVVVAKHSGDHMFVSKTGNVGNDTSDQETILQIGPWSERNMDGSTSSGGVNTRMLLLCPKANRFSMSNTALRGEHLGNLNNVGLPADWTRKIDKEVQCQS